MSRPAALRASLPLLVALLLPQALGGCGSDRRRDDGITGAAEAAPPAESAASGAPPGGPPKSAPRDDPFARLVLQDPQGRAIKMSEFAGKVRLLDVWASWCGPCRMIIPHLNDLYARYHGKGLVIVGMSIDSSPGDVEAFTSRLPIKYPTGMATRDILELLGNPDSVPTTFLVDRTGRVRRKFIGYVEPALMEREVRKFLEPG